MPVILIYYEYGQNTYIFGGNLDPRLAYTVTHNHKLLSLNIKNKKNIVNLFALTIIIVNYRHENNEK